MLVYSRVFRPIQRLQQVHLPLPGCLAWEPSAASAARDRRRPATNDLRAGPSDIEKKNGDFRGEIHEKMSYSYQLLLYHEKNAQ